MKRLRPVLYIGLLLLVFCSGCASSGHWYKPDMATEIYEQDVYQCHRDAQFAYPGTHPGLEIDRSNWFEDCMRSKGYKWVKD